MGIESGTRAEAVMEHLRSLQAGVEAGRDFFEPGVVEQAGAELRTAEQRMELGSGLTVVALVGGTGSGKSSMFNALTGFDFADAGDLRPTTERASACVWGADASALLDYLGVDQDRRIRHDSILTGGDHEHAGLVLLDLPDQDSVQIAHSALVDRLIPLIDLLVWVVDPQKYADHLLHRQYLEKLTNRRDAILVVMNHIDTVAQRDRDVLMDDLRRLLDSDGLEGVPILPASALTHEGIAQVDEYLRRAVREESMTTKTAIAGLSAIAGRLAGQMGSEEVILRGSPLDAIIDDVERASGVPAVVGALRSDTALFGSSAVTKPEQPAPTMVTAIRDTWMAKVQAGMPPRWQAGLDASVASSDRLRRELGRALQHVSVPSVRKTGGRAVFAVALMLAITGVVLAVLGIPSPSVIARMALGVGAVAVAVLGYWIARMLVRRSARKQAAMCGTAIRDALAAALDAEIVAGPEGILERHRIARLAVDTLARGGEHYPHESVGAA
ncbi:MAG: 50S ribosome-binding GTPase [Actinomycetaceae bacterium]|nr:50S ribosome-binding GTPase [Arcanobacterium sp.]MDD7504963.1 50S ribosome-binding GTPase [Actinomycetaceae bacterium]MDY6143714.1 GTPase [Arcanobacterium sp.]